jgi:DNA (cytosine-5)-methyltransferase 1
MIKTGSDFSGVGAFDQALNRLGIEQDKLFACDMDEYARTTYIHNYGEPKYYPKDVYERDIPEESLDIYMTSPPCQAFSLAGNRKGEVDNRGILFYNSHEFIMKNKPRFFIFENVKGLLSDDGGQTFQKWCSYLGGKSINGTMEAFPYADAAPYHIYWKVLNAKNYGVPQNRERVFIVGIRDDEDNVFRWPKEERLTTRLKDILEEEVDEKYYLSEKAIKGFIKHRDRMKERGNGFGFDPTYGDDYASCVSTRAGSRPDDNFIKVKSAVKKGYEEAREGDSISLQQPNSETRRGRVGNQVAQTLDTGCSQAVMIGAMRGRGEKGNTEQQIEINETGNSNSLTTVQKDNLVIQLNPSKESGGQQPYQQNRVFDPKGGSPAVLANLGGDRNHNILENEFKIRRLTPRECFRLMSFPETFDFSCVSDTQAYKQAGNSIVVAVLEKIIANLKL